jgi:ABC-type multidrug transport system fused ATPase/permease subunit
MLVGSMKKIKGNAFLSGKIAYLPDKFLFSSASVRDNIAFYNNAVTDKQIREIYNQLGLKDDIKHADGLSL